MYQIKPFFLTGFASNLTPLFPEKDFFFNRLLLLNEIELDSFIRLWLTEGFPYAFNKRPMLFEIVRFWLARELNVQPKDLILIGSARAGFSLTPGEEFGNKFSTESDLDFALISSSCFCSLVDAFSKWKDDYLSGDISPANANEKRYWSNNIDQLPKNINFGFIDPYKIAHRKKYDPVVLIQDALSRLKIKINVTPDCPKIKNVSLRVFKNWDAFMRRARLNLKAIPKRV